MWVIHKVRTVPNVTHNAEGVPKEWPLEIQVPNDEVWLYLGLEQSCGGAPCKLVFLTRKRDDSDAEVGGRIDFLGDIS